MSDTGDFIVRRGVLAPDFGEAHPWGRLGFFSDADTTGVDGVTVGMARIEAGESNPLHIHGNCSEIALILSGSVAHVVGAQVVNLAAGDMLIVPPGLPHRATSTGPGPAEMVIVYNSGHRGFEVLSGMPAD